MNLTSEAARALAPDSQVAAAAAKLARPAQWQNLGCNIEALWGECRGSAVYQVAVDLADMAFRCSCPSRKHPCKHAVGLLLLGADAPPAEAPAPSWVTEWLSKRRDRAARREEAPPSPEPKRSTKPPQDTARERKRLERVLQGADAIDLWMEDTIRTGLARVEMQPASWWQQQAARLVDAQAPGLAERVRQMAALPGSGADWPDRLLTDMGLLALLTHALRRLDTLPIPLQHDVRRLVGWSLKTLEVDALGESIADEWAAIGRRVEDGGSLWVQRTWLVGRRSKRNAFVLQFAPGRHPSFPWVVNLGTSQEMELHFWPGAAPQRARIAARSGEVSNLQSALPHGGTIRHFLDDVAAILEAAPWTDRFLGVFHDVIPVRSAGGRWWIQDDDDALPLHGQDHWELLALSGGHPIDLAGEWHNSELYPLSVVAEGRFYQVTA